MAMRSTETIEPVQRDDGKLEKYWTVTANKHGPTLTATVSLSGLPAEPERPIQSMVPTPSISRGAKLLVVDDHPTNREVLARQLELLGFATDIAGNGDMPDLFLLRGHDVWFGVKII